MDFAHEQGWSLEDGRIQFPGLEKENAEEGDKKEVIHHMVGYARELEMIV